MTAYHFMDQGFPKSSVHYLQCLSRFERTGSIERKRGSGRIAIKWTKENILAFLNESLQCDLAVASHIFVLVELLLVL